MLKKRKARLLKLMSVTYLTFHLSRGWGRRSSWIVERLKGAEEKKRVIIEADERNVSRIPLVKI